MWHAIERRALLGHLALLLGTAALPQDALGAAAKHAVLRGPALALAVAVADTLVPATDTPGALAAGVPATFDGMLAHWATPATRAELLAALDAVDLRARREAGQAFAALPAPQRAELLARHDLAALQLAKLPPGEPPRPALLGGPPVVDQGYARLKQLIVSLYYASEIGLTHELAYEHVPGEWVPSLRIAPGMRPSAAFGPF